ncbi:tRNA-dihydrouridine synthase [Myriangium duriaei CBS 260.36]|uniref:tRNA-dihydrouridine synthase n=1 Tax=Myriangium duriaei CBS 260.36 TaxID=1168546 RepID=A0A9P4JCI8_9PEZI|nr:tRNA-dihydrouridine synthase [Myriangium duriaei CBS 260.36]
MTASDGGICDAKHVDRKNPVYLFETAKSQNRALYVCAPMVRYSKLPFRLLVQEYGVDISYTPMMLAHEFIRHPVARDSDFTTNDDEGPVIAQFASSDPQEFSRAACLISPWVNGVDLNCGCPQSWAIREGIGCSLMSKPALVRDIVAAAKSVLGPDKSVSIKIRIHKDIQTTINFLNTVLEAEPDFVTVHARTRSQRSSTPPDLEALKILKSHFPDLPMIANGDVFTREDAEHIMVKTGVQGAMSARGILENPCLFAGYDTTPIEAVRKIMSYSTACGLRYELAQYHVHEMLTKALTKRERKQLMECKDMIELTDWLEEKANMQRGDLSQDR